MGSYKWGYKRWVITLATLHIARLIATHQPASGLSPYMHQHHLRSGKSISGFRATLNLNPSPYVKSGPLTRPGAESGVLLNVRT